MTAKKLGFIPIAVDVSEVEYDPLSIQGWTKSVARFIPYDFLARIFFLLTGKI